MIENIKDHVVDFIHTFLLYVFVLPLFEFLIWVDYGICYVKKAWYRINKITFIGKVYAK